MVEAVPIHRLPLSHDVISAFRVLATIPGTEPVDHPLAPTRTVCKMPDGRFVLCEMSGGVGAVIGSPVTQREAADIAKTLLAPDLPASPAGLALRILATAVLGLIGDQQPVMPVARSAS